MRVKPKDIEALLKAPPAHTFDDDPNFRFWKWLRPLEVNDFYGFDDKVTPSSDYDSVRIFNENAIYGDWKVKDPENEDNVLYFTGMQHKKNESKHGIVRIVNRMEGSITEANFREDMRHGLYRKFMKHNKDKFPIVIWRVYKKGEKVAEIMYERNLNLIRK